PNHLHARWAQSRRWRNICLRSNPRTATQAQIIDLYPNHLHARWAQSRRWRNICLRSNPRTATQAQII
ncbi:hypothetical protein, partial [Salmonella enterica]|uniref:hypothetical protein n=1 Tax=Salmonella enterica TaxID=28901 RepID=UPI002A7509FC